MPPTLAEEMTSSMEGCCGAIGSLPTSKGPRPQNGRSSPGRRYGVLLSQASGSGAQTLAQPSGVGRWATTAPPIRQPPSGLPEVEDAWTWVPSSCDAALCSRQRGDFDEWRGDRRRRSRWRLAGFGFLRHRSSVELASCCCLVLELVGVIELWFL